VFEQAHQAIILRVSDNTRCRNCISRSIT